MEIVFECCVINSYNLGRVLTSQRFFNTEQIHRNIFSVTFSMDIHAFSEKVKTIPGPRNTFFTENIKLSFDG